MHENKDKSAGIYGLLGEGTYQRYLKRKCRPEDGVSDVPVHERSLSVRAHLIVSGPKLATLFSRVSYRIRQIHGR